MFFTRLHLDGVGTTDARLRELDIPLDDPVNGLPSDSVIWIRNGGGKTSLLSLVFSLFLPAQRHFVWTRTEGRTLGDYVLSGDTSLVSVRLHTPHGPIVAGAYYEWPDRRRPTEWRNRGGELARNWFVFRAQPGVLDIADLPRRDESGRLLTLRESIGALERMSRAHPGLRLSVCRTQTEWSTALGAAGIDTGLLEAQLRVAGIEGGFEALFAVNSHVAFVNRLIELLTDDGAASSLSQRIEAQTETLRRLPAMQLERSFADELAERLRAVADAAAASSQLDHAAAQALSEADVLAARFVAAGAVAEEAADAADAAAALAAAQRSEAYQERTVEQNRAAAFARREAVIRLTAAEAELAAINDQLQQAEQRARAWDAVEQVVAVESALNEVHELRREQVALETQAAPQREKLERAAAFLRHRLQALEQAALLRRNLALKRRSAADAHISELKAAEQDARHRHAVADATIEQVADSLRALDADLAAARGRGDIEQAELPDAALQRWNDTADTENRLADAAAEQESVERAAADSAESSGEAARQQLVPARSRATETAAALQAVSDAHQRLVSNERVREITGTDAPDPWAAGALLGEALRALIDDTERSAGEIAVATARVGRSLAALSGEGLLPPVDDVSDVLSVLEAAGVAATSGFTYLSRSIAPARWSEAIEAHPDICAGVVVSADDLDAAGHALRDLEPTTPVVIADKAMLDHHGDRTGRVVLAPLRAAYDPEAAPAVRTALEVRRDELAAERRTIKAVIDDLRNTQDLLARLFELCATREHLEQLEADDAEAAARVAILETDEREAWRSPGLTDSWCVGDHAALAVS